MGDEADRLRTRATDLRSLATAIEGTRAMEIDHLMGTSAWRGPRAESCVDELRRHQRRIHVVADELRWRARRLDRLAIEIDTPPP